LASGARSSGRGRAWLFRKTGTVSASQLRSSWLLFPLPPLRLEEGFALWGDLKSSAEAMSANLECQPFFGQRQTRRVAMTLEVPTPLTTRWNVREHL
jgi:hypothetical protein